MRLEHRSVNGTIEGLRVLAGWTERWHSVFRPKAGSARPPASPSVLAAISLGSVYAGLEPKETNDELARHHNAAAAVTLLSTPINTAISIDEHATPPMKRDDQHYMPLADPHLELAPDGVPKGTFTIVCVGQD